MTSTASVGRIGTRYAGRMSLDDRLGTVLQEFSCEYHFLPLYRDLQCDRTLPAGRAHRVLENPEHQAS